MIHDVIIIIILSWCFLPTVIVIILMMIVIIIGNCSTRLDVLYLFRHVIQVRCTLITQFLDLEDAIRCVNQVMVALADQIS